MGLRGSIMRGAADFHAALFRRFTSPRIHRIAGLPIMLLTVAGRRSGRALTTPLVYLEHEGGYAVVASAGGQTEAPQWFKNLRAATQATIDLGDGPREVDVRIAPEPERQGLWARFLAEGTTFASYERRTDRVFGIAVLTPR
ncbi:nitroreductase/quinone reductase family protein [Agrococcus sp. BE272]|uniref:nitroreductase/quinone reductase family protein n=1 Tax=Agrococcus sp. BE272 TaxID=2817727 RepID=UPI002863C7B1|nr:nitroreductase/quinone reductase family protein [Agrococcus sp. BE272]MDR7233959.1 deazaflavin-dependent oxidoreductase (nitroreductase family) [Agrococcus sp. BE272]